jgi:predicted metal-dependent hydrolase
MPTLQIGRKEIAYELHRSATALERRITVTPGRVEVLALTADDEDEIAGFLDRKRRWLFDAVREMERVTAGRHGVPHFSTGSKVPYRGRNVRLTVRRTDAQRLEIAYRNGFIVDLPEWAEGNPDRLIASELKLWLKQSARRDVNAAAASIGKRFDLTPRSIRVSEFANGWGSCGPEGSVLINWHLIFAPRKVLEYVVAHELAHLRHRTHGRDFWTFVKSMMPDFERPKAWLEANQSILSDDFLKW